MLHRNLFTIAFIAAAMVEGCASAGSVSTSRPSSPAPSPEIPASPAATSTPVDTVGPSFNSITTSSTTFTRAECPLDFVTVTANISDASGVVRVVLWYRVGSDQPYAPASVTYEENDTYTATVKGKDVPGSEFGAWEFYIMAEDGAGNRSQSPVDTSVSLLPCFS